MRERISLLGLWLALVLTGAAADELWVSNQPFPGQTRGSGQDMMVEARMFLKVMEIEADDQGEVIVIADFPIPVEEIEGVRYVHLRDVVDAVGLKISSNAELGTVDVRRASAGTGYKGEWNASSSSTESGSEIDGTVTTLAGDFFSVNIPSHLLVVADARYLKSGESENAKVSNLNIYPSFLGSQNVCAVSPSYDISQGGLVMAYIPGMVEKVTSQNEAELLDVLKSELARGGAQQIGPMSSTNIAGNRFHRIQTREMVEGVVEDTEYNIHFNNKHGVLVLMMIVAPKRSFSRVAPQLRLVINNLRFR